jgi:hypothetical protein
MYYEMPLVDLRVYILYLLVRIKALVISWFSEHLMTLTGKMLFNFPEDLGGIIDERNDFNSCPCTQ